MNNLCDCLFCKDIIKRKVDKDINEFLEMG